MNLDRIIAVRTDKTVYRSGNLCLKVFNGNFSKADVLNEALIQSKLEETGLNIPKIREVTSSNGKWIIVSDYIKGNTLDRLCEENPKKAEEYMNLFVNLQLEIHKREFALPYDLKKKTSDKIKLAALPDAVCKKLFMSINALPDCGKLCHGDFNMSNIIIDKRGIPYILDWSHASCGDPLFDAAVSYTEFLLDCDKNGAAMYLDIFCSLTGISESCITNKIPAAAAAKIYNSNERKREILYSLIK